MTRCETNANTGFPLFSEQGEWKQLNYRYTLVLSDRL
jgi:hypothetical protein